MYNNITRPGIRTSSTINPRRLVEDVDMKIRRLKADATPFLTLMSYLKRGPKPLSWKVQQMEYHENTNRDYISSVTMGASVDAANYSRYALIKLDSPDRPEVPSDQYYYPQDKFYIAKTDDVVEVVCTPYASIPISTTSTATFAAALTGSTTTATAAGYILVRNIKTAPLKPFSSSDVLLLGRNIYESQKIEAQPRQRDVIFDANFVEHKECVVQITQDQKEWIKTKGVLSDWDFLQEEAISDFKRDIENNIWFGERSVDMTVPGRPKHNMRGFYNSIKTNMAYYNPDAVTNFEELIQNFCMNQAFRYNPNGDSKIAFCGMQFLVNFNNTFREYRQLQNETKISEMGLNVNSYVLPGGFKLKLIRNEMLAQDTDMTHWCFVVDPVEAEMRIVDDMKQKFYQNNDERDVKLMIEWKGTVAWHLEQSNAILRTF
jgi:hypothetical protein